MATFTRLTALVLSTRTLPLGLAALVAVVFWPALDNGWVWDDRPNFVGNQAFRGVGWPHLRWMATTTLLGQWIPLSWLTLGLDYLVWGMNPRGYHLTNVVLHAAVAVVFYFVARRLLRAATAGWPERVLTLGAAAAALFFAIHPLRAESVAWVTERRDVLSGFWFLCTVLTYLRAHDLQARRRPWLLVSVGCFALAVLSKSMVVTLPAVLVLLDVYPLGRLPWAPRHWLSRANLRAVWLEKVPYAALSGAGIAMAFYAQQSHQFLTSLQKVSIADRVVLVAHSLWFYATTTVVPLRLAVLYELPPRVDPFQAPFVVSMVAVAGVAVGLPLALPLLRRRWPAGLAVVAAYVIMISPVSGLFHNGHQTVADRYSYLPCLGLAVLFGFGVAAAVRAGATGHLKQSVALAVVGAATLVLVGNAALTVHQVGVWRDTDTLWRFALDTDPNCAICHNNLGDDLLRRGMPESAKVEFEQALALRPDLIKIRKNLGLALLSANHPEEAGEEFRKVLTADPSDGEAWTNLGVVLLQQHKRDEAVQAMEEAIQRAPTSYGIYVNLGAALVDSGRASEAVPHLERALTLNPKSAYAHANLVRAYTALGQTDRAGQQFEVLRGLDPQMAKRVGDPVALSVATP